MRIMRKMFVSFKVINVNFVDKQCVAYLGQTLTALRVKPKHDVLKVILEEPVPDKRITYLYC